MMILVGVALLTGGSEIAIAQGLPPFQGHRLGTPR